jgi:DNA replication protein DnaC
VKPDQTEQNLERLHASIRRIKEIVDTPEYQESSKLAITSDAAFRRQQEAIYQELRLQDSGILARYQPFLDSPQRTEALAAVATFLAGPPERTFLVLAGPAGRGKTTALSVGVWRAGGYYYDAQELLRESTFFPDLWRRLQATPFLALDELGSETTNPAWEANLFDLLNGRDARLIKTALATNLNAKAFRDRYITAGLARLMDRLSTSGDFMTFPGESLRRHWSECDSDDPENNHKPRLT